MTAVGALVRLITILIVAAALPCRAEDVISGRWEGTAQIPDDELTVVVDLAQEDAAWVGSIIIPGLGLKGAPLTNIKVQPPDVNFAVKGAVGIQLKLRLDANNKLAGNFEQAGNRAPATLQKTGPPQVEYPLRNTPVAKELEGEWKGDYEMLGYKPSCVDQVCESPGWRDGGLWDCRAETQRSACRSCHAGRRSGDGRFARDGVQL
jgi:hypothetical protein